MNCLLDKIGNTPLVHHLYNDNKKLNLFFKLELYNPTGSIKDRAAAYMLKTLLNRKIINKNTTIIESSSGNFGIALAAHCRRHKLKFICVVDPHITPINEILVKAYGGIVIKVTQPDENGGYLINRIKRVNELVNEIDNSYWINQYENPLNAEAYHTLGEELVSEVKKIDYIFLGVSSGGTITGVSTKIKELLPDTKIIAVDVEGSVIFGGQPKKRLIPGIGSSKVPKILENAKIDEVVVIDELETIKSCHELMEKYFIFAGGSSGSVYAAIKKYFNAKNINKSVNVVAILADRGERYTDTIYNEEWCKKYIREYSKLYVLEEELNN
jgi:cysteine synthase A